jgi:hypothetical protein
MTKRMMKCPKKIKGKCKATGNDCNHAVKHKHNPWCGIETISLELSCPPCVDIEK